MFFGLTLDVTNLWGYLLKIGFILLILLLELYLCISDNVLNSYVLECRTLLLPLCHLLRHLDMYLMACRWVNTPNIDGELQKVPEYVRAEPLFTRGDWTNPEAQHLDYQTLKFCKITTQLTFPLSASILSPNMHPHLHTKDNTGTSPSNTLSSFP